MNQVHAAPGFGVSGPGEKVKASRKCSNLCSKNRQEWGSRGGLEGVPDLNNAVNGANDAAATAKTNGEAKN